MLPLSLYVSFEFYRRHHHQDAATKRTKKFKHASIKSFARGVFHPWKKSKSFSCRPIRPARSNLNWMKKQGKLKPRSAPPIIATPLSSSPGGPFVLITSFSPSTTTGRPP